MNLLTRFLRGNRENKYNNSFFSFFGGGEAKYDYNKIDYIEKGYNINPFVYSIVSARANKFSAVPFEICEISDEEAENEYRKLLQTTKHNLTPQQKYIASKLYKKAYGGIKDFQLQSPNPLQSWSEFRELFEIYLATVGEVYVYKLSPEGGADAGKPIALYLLPSHYMEIVIKDGYKIETLESPVKKYMFIEGDQYTEFKPEEIIHVKYANPNYDVQATSIYGNAPLRACWKNVLSSNEALGLNIKTMKNAGAFGIIHAKGGTSLTEPQAKALKQKLKEMDAGSDRLDKIAGVSSEIGFTRLTLPTKDLQQFDFLKFDEKQICNALGWDAKLLNNDDGAKYDNYKSAQKRVLIDTIVPDLNIFKQVFNEKILPLYGDTYKNHKLEYKINDLPEMQEDMKNLVEWCAIANDKAFISKNDAREFMGLDRTDDENMNLFTTTDDLLTLEQSLDDFPAV